MTHGNVRAEHAQGCSPARTSFPCRIRKRSMPRMWPRSPSVWAELSNAVLGDGGAERLDVLAFYRVVEPIDDVASPRFGHQRVYGRTS